jgi:hypothetical protein
MTINRAQLLEALMRADMHTIERLFQIAGRSVERN